MALLPFLLTQQFGPFGGGPGRRGRALDFLGSPEITTPGARIPGVAAFPFQLLAGRRRRQQQGMVERLAVGEGRRAGAAAALAARRQGLTGGAGAAFEADAAARARMAVLPLLLSLMQRNEQAAQQDFAGQMKMIATVMRALSGAGFPMGGMVPGSGQSLGPIGSGMGRPAPADFALA